MINVLTADASAVRDGWSRRPGRRKRADERPKPTATGRATCLEAASQRPRRLTSAAATHAATPCSNTMQQHHAATPCTYRRISSINASFCLICIDLTPCEREKLCISVAFRHLTYAYRANFSRTANKLIEAQLSGSQQRASHGAMPRTASRKRRSKGAGQEALGPESQVVGQEALGPPRYRVQRSQIRRSARIRERRILAPPRCRLRERRILAPPRCRLRERGAAERPQRRIRGAGAAVASAAPGPKVPGYRAHTTSDAEQTDVVAARISPHPVARRA